MAGSLGLQFIFSTGPCGNEMRAPDLGSALLQSTRVRRLNPPFHASPLHNGGLPFGGEQHYLPSVAGWADGRGETCVRHAGSFWGAAPSSRRWLGHPQLLEGAGLGYGSVSPGFVQGRSPIKGLFGRKLLPEQRNSQTAWKGHVSLACSPRAHRSACALCSSLS